MCVHDFNLHLGRLIELFKLTLTTKTTELHHFPEKNKERCVHFTDMYTNHVSKLIQAKVKPWYNFL